MVKTVEELYGTVIGEIDCPACDAPVPLKVNKNGRVFWRCDAPTGKERPSKNKRKKGEMVQERCYERHYYSEQESENILRKYMKGQQDDRETVDEVHIEQDIEQPEKGNGDGSEREPAAGSAAGTAGDEQTGLGYFLNR